MDIPGASRRKREVPCYHPPGMTLEIHPATLRDLAALQRIERACFPEDAWPLLDLIAVLTWPDVTRLKAVVDGKMVGFIAADPRPAQDVTWIATLGVEPDYQRQGIASALLLACEKLIRTGLIRLCVRIGNTAAIRLYESKDYGRLDIWEGYYNDGSNALVMEKPVRRIGK
ncbi:MAG: GNAT family N-acetyltransferase [Chloroflexi bacterium]|nr:GNAT family N-acetyltransferase [Chloroflexota bacterium]